MRLTACASECRVMKMDTGPLEPCTASAPPPARTRTCTCTHTEPHNRSTTCTRTICKSMSFGTNTA